MSDFSTILVESPDRLIAFGDLESLCDGAYEEVLESGSRHREEISQYSQWEDVIQAMMTPLRHFSTFSSH